jgi:hypothetical protein
MTPKRLSVLLSVIWLVSFAYAQHPQKTPSSYPPQQLLDRIRPDGIRAQMSFLADDLLEGRGTGTRGYMLSSNYIAAQFQEIGLNPGCVDVTYYQKVHLRDVKLVPEQTSLVVKRDGQDETLVLDKDYLVEGNALYPDASVEAPVVFVGYGMTAPEFHYDDYAGIDVKGKIVLMFRGAPQSFGSAPGAVYSDSDVKIANAAAHGAVGTLRVWAGPIARRVPFAAIVRYYHSPAMRWLDDKGAPNDTPPQLHGSASLNSDAAAKMFTGAPKSLVDALAAAEEGKSQSFPLPVTAALHIVSRHSDVESPNIAAILPGSDPELSKQYVVFTAHVDHLGIGEPVNGDSIYNGAGDNASGTAALLELARAFSSSPKPLRRSLLFLAVTGEEEGLLGSDYFAHYPTVPMPGIVANVNMDEIAFLYDFKDIVPLGAEHSSLGAVVADVAHRMGLEVSPDPAPEEVYFIRSDQYSFVRQGVPSVFLGAGYKALDPKIDGKKMNDDWEAHRYHMPSDDMGQPLDFNAAAKNTRVILAVGYEVAQQEDRPSWNQGDFFLRFAQWWQNAGH